MLGSPRSKSNHGQNHSRLSHSPYQASAAFPENTLASFEAAINDGADGIESGI
ncbi:hypothetical protein BDR07DRAFT_1388211 [Suillus spraguei]|nr:hypothetical protein BDR07DRAFT_1388211 [Suillus spraguei]